MEVLLSVLLLAKFLQHCWQEAKLHLQKPAQNKAELRKFEPAV
jgi:hypothetical protein